MTNEEKRKQELLKELGELIDVEVAWATIWEAEGLDVVTILLRLVRRRERRENDKLHNWLDLDKLDE